MNRDAYHVPQNSARLGHQFRAQSPSLHLDRVGLEEWQEYELLNARANATYTMEADADYFARRSHEPRDRVRRRPRRRQLVAA